MDLSQQVLQEITETDMIQVLQGGKAYMLPLSVLIAHITWMIKETPHQHQAVDVHGLAAVAMSGEYEDLKHKPDHPDHPEPPPEPPVDPEPL